MSKNRSGFVTGMGVISPLGLDVESTWAGVSEGKSGIDFITAFDTEGFDTKFAAEVKGFEPEAYLDRKDARRMDRFAQFAAVAAGARFAGRFRSRRGFGGIGHLPGDRTGLRRPRRFGPTLEGSSKLSRLTAVALTDASRY